VPRAAPPALWASSPGIRLPLYPSWY
jgi:hypothetical protein